MMRVTRRAFIASAGGALAMAALSKATDAQAGEQDWVEVIGMAPEGPYAHRQALGDAILAAALAGGAQVRGHSALSMTRVTSDLLIIRPTGRVISHRVIGESVSNGIRQVTIRARVAPANSGLCGSGRRLALTIYPPAIRVAPDAPAWAETLAQSVAADLIALAQSHPAVAESRLISQRPSAGRRPDYATLISGSRAVAPGGHGFDIDLTIAPERQALQLTARLALNGPAGERLEKVHAARVPVPGPSLTGRAAPVGYAQRGRLSGDLAAGAVPALDHLLKSAACGPVVARAMMKAGRLSVPVGRIHGVTRTSLAATADDGSTLPELVEVVRLADREAELRPLDPTRAAAALDGRVLRFIDSVVALQ